MASAAATPSPHKRKVSDDGLTPYAKRLPAPAETGNELIDGGNSAAHKALKAIISACQNDWSHVLPLQGLLQKRQEHLNIEAECHHADRFKFFGSFRQVREQDWYVKVLVEISDMTEDDILSLLAHDPEIIWKLLEKALQMSLTSKLDEGLRVKDIFWRFIQDRAKHCGDSLKEIKKAGAIQEIKEQEAKKKVFNMRDFGAYVLEFCPVDNKLSRVTHNATGHSVEIKDTYIDNTFSLKENTLDLTAQMCPNDKKRYPPFHLKAFFDGTGQGPEAITQFEGKAGINQQKKLMADFVEAYWKKKEADAVPESKTAKEKIDKMQKDAAKKKLDCARVKAKELAQQRAGLREHSFGNQ